MADPVRTIDLTPTADELARILRRFADVIVADVKVSRRNADAALLAGAIDCAYVLGRNGYDREALKANVLQHLDTRWGAEGGLK